VALLETLTIQAGAALVKAAAKSWLEDHAFAEAAAGGLVDGLKKKIEDFATRDSAETLLRSVQREVGRRLEAFLAIEFRGPREWARRLARRRWLRGTLARAPGLSRNPDRRGLVVRRCFVGREPGPCWAHAVG